MRKLTLSHNISCGEAYIKICWAYPFAATREKTCTKHKKTSLLNERSHQTLHCLYFIVRSSCDHIFYSNIVFDFKHDAAPIARHRLMAHSMSLGEVSCKTKCKKLQNRTIACRITGLSSQSSCWVCKQHTKKKKTSFAWLLSTFLSAH